jgi:hypothetical protein
MLVLKCIDYRELNKSILKGNFPLLFIDQILDTLARKNIFSFLDGFSCYNQIQISLEVQDNTIFTFPFRIYDYQVIPFGLCNSISTSQRVVLGIFFYLIHACVEVYMDDFIVYGSTFEKDMNNLEKVLRIFQETNLSVIHEKYYMLLTKGIVLGHDIYPIGIRVDPIKVGVIS